MMPHSLDLRQKTVNAYLAGGISQRQVAANFGVALSFVSKMILSYKRYGSVAPREPLYNNPSKLNDEQLEVLRQLVLDNSDATLAEYRQLLFNETEVLLSVSSIDRLVRLKLGFTSKKKAYSQAKKRVSGC
jgi:transposase